MGTAVRRQIKVWRQDWIVMGLIILGFGIFGKILFQIIVHFDKEVVEYFPLATLLTAIGAAIFSLIMAAVQLPMYFNMEVSLGCTRKHFFVSFFAASIIGDAICWIIAIVINIIENAMNRALYPTWESEFDMLPYVIKWGLPVLVLLTVVGGLCGVLVMHFGRVAFWIMWALWMFACIGLPQISEAAHEAPDSLYGRIGAAIIDFVTSVPVNAWIIAGVALCAGSLVGVWGLLRKQQVTA